MFFLLRVAFWLAIVFASVSWPGDGRPPGPAEIAPKAREILGKALDQARAGAVKACAGAPIACLEAAANVSQMVGEKRRDGKTKAPLEGPANRP